MCGIAALLLAPQPRSPAEWQAIWQHFTANLPVNEARGTAATGVAIANTRGQIVLHKQPITATVFTQTLGYRTLCQSLDDQTVLILGHTRYPTQGDPSHDQNNHPLLTGHSLGIHNGHIVNSDEIFRLRHLPRDAAVDSEIIFRLLDTLVMQPLDLAEFATSLRVLQGKFTFLAIQQRQPTHLLIVRHRNPLSLHYQSDWEALSFSSSYLFLRQAFGQCVLHEQVPKDEVLLFDATQLAWCHAAPIARQPLYIGTVTAVTSQMKI